MLPDYFILHGDYWGVPLGMVLAFLASRGNCWHRLRLPYQPSACFSGAGPSFFCFDVQQGNGARRELSQVLNEFEGVDKYLMAERLSLP